MKSILFFCCLCFSLSFYSQVLNIEIDAGKFQIDNTNLLIVSHIEDIENYTDLDSFDEVNMILDGAIYPFVIIPELLEYSSSYTLTNGTDEFILYFTQIPIITVDSENEIVDEPKVLANFTYTDDDQTVNSFIGIELRGGTSQTFPKKTYDIEFWEDENGNETLNYQFGLLRDDDDWIMDGMYNEPLRIRSYLSHKLWLEMHQPHYSIDEPDAKSGADVMYVELFLNQVYNGVYALSEQVDKKQLKIKSFNGTIRGELYKGETWGATTFSDLPEYDNSSRIWGGYEYKYPKENQITEWEYLYDFTDFVMFSSNTDYIATIWNRFNKVNGMDYFIFLNLLRATDNTGKNIYLSKYDSDYSYFYIPWDLDGTWGTIWDGTNDPTTNDILLNGFFQRNLDQNPDNYKGEIKNTWFNYRTDLLELNNLINTINTAYYYLKNNNVYSRESVVHGNYNFDEASKDYMINWLQQRLDFLDTYYENNLNNTHFERGIKRIVYPNPTKDILYITNSSNAPYYLYSIDGKLVKKGTINSENYIKTSNLENGVYFLNVDKQTFKVLKTN